MSSAARTSALRELRLLLEWALEQGMSIRGRLTLEQLSQLGRVFCQGEPWSFELYEPLRAFSHAAARLELPDLPARLHFGDALVALNELLVQAADSGAASGLLGDGLRRYDWQLQHQLEPQAFAELGYARTSAGISALRAKHRAGWQAHAHSNRELLLRGCADAGPGTLAILGAGKLYDVPLKQLSERFEHLLLIDVDEASLAESAARVASGELARRVTLLGSEVTGIAGGFVAALRDVFDGRPGPSLSEQDTCDALLALLYSFRSPAAPSLAPERALNAALGDKPELCAVASSMLLSQLAVPLTELLEQRFAQRFPASQRLRRPELQLALGQFSHRVQHAHVQALLGQSPLAVITTDIAEQPLRWTPSGIEPAGSALPLIGAPQLADLLPRAEARLGPSAQWYWRRVLPSPKSPHGRLLEVNGCAVSTSAR